MADGDVTGRLMAAAIERVGVVHGSRAVAVVVAWATAERDLGHALGAADGAHLTAAVREYAEYWRRSQRTAWREVKRFRAAFPEEESPARLAGELERRSDARREAAHGRMAARQRVPPARGGAPAVPPA
jgi:hypothetical protein